MKLAEMKSRQTFLDLRLLRGLEIIGRIFFLMDGLLIYVGVKNYITFDRTRRG